MGKNTAHLSYKILMHIQSYEELLYPQRTRDILGKAFTKEQIDLVGMIR